MKEKLYPDKICFGNFLIKDTFGNPCHKWKQFDRNPAFTKGIHTFERIVFE